MGLLWGVIKGTNDLISLKILDWKQTIYPERYLQEFKNKKEQSA